MTPWLCQLCQGFIIYGWFGGVWNYPFTAFCLSSSQHQVMRFQKWCQASQRPISPMKCPPLMASLILCNCTMTILLRSVCVRCAGERWEVCRVSGARYTGWVVWGVQVSGVRCAGWVVWGCRVSGVQVSGVRCAGWVVGGVQGEWWKVCRVRVRCVGWLVGGVQGEWCEVVGWVVGGMSVSGGVQGEWWEVCRVSGGRV